MWLKRQFFLIQCMSRKQPYIRVKGSYCANVLLLQCYFTFRPLSFISFAPFSNTDWRGQKNIKNEERRQIPLRFYAADCTVYCTSIIRYVFSYDLFCFFYNCCAVKFLFTKLTSNRCLPIFVQMWQRVTKIFDLRCFWFNLNLHVHTEEIVLEI